MKRRNAEQQNHNFEQKFMLACGIYDLQGLLLGDDDQFTAAIEAFTYDSNENVKNVRDSTLSYEHYYAILTLLQQLKINLHVFVHKTGTKEILHYVISKDIFMSDDKNNPSKITEDEFVDWWKKNKKTIQQKAYREDMQEMIGKSYYDQLLERNGLKWGGNIDGFVAVLNQDFKPVAIVENRFSKVKTIKEYDPAIFYNKSDKGTWRPLFLLCKYLKLPLFLCTYSKRENEENYVGISKVDLSSADKEVLKYKDDIPPCNRIFSDIMEAKAFLMEAIRQAKE